MKKNGFTLIELLAVIVVLAIIVLIATPIVLNIINNAKTSSNERSGELYIKAVENAIMKKQMNGTTTVDLNTTYVVDINGNICKSTYYESTSESEKTTFVCPTNDTIEIFVDGDKPDLGSTITLGDKGIVIDYNMTISGTSIVKPVENGNNDNNQEFPIEYYNFAYIMEDDDNEIKRGFAVKDSNTYYQLETSFSSQRWNMYGTFDITLSSLEECINEMNDSNLEYDIDSFNDFIESLTVDIVLKSIVNDSGDEYIYFYIFSNNYTDAYKIEINIFENSSESNIYIDEEPYIKRTKEYLDITKFELIEEMHYILDISN